MTVENDGDNVRTMKASRDVVNPDPVAHARIRARQAEAEGSVIIQITAFLKALKSGGEKELGRNPFSDDILPYFQEYARTMFDAEARERVKDSLSTREKLDVLTDLPNYLANEISNRRGVWRRAVKRACESADFNLNITQFGSYTSDVFYRPRKMQLRAFLQVHAQTWKTKVWESEEHANAGGSPKSKIRSVTSLFPGRAEWLRKRLLERHCTRNHLHEKKGAPDPKTLRLIWNGGAVSEESLVKLAKALSHHPWPTIKPCDIPNN